jgi:hypothetical protein
LVGVYILYLLKSNLLMALRLVFIIFILIISFHLRVWDGMMLLMFIMHVNVNLSVVIISTYTRPFIFSLMLPK